NIKPSYTRDYYGSDWVVSGVSIMDRERTLRGEYLQEFFYETDSMEFAVNVNTQEELDQARRIIGAVGSDTQRINRNSLSSCKSGAPCPEYLCK
ncbi:MAG: hypothetical protein LBH88_00130, partial [Candidatus Methanoplasma sp.]|nr:hypothetical protein [Candidatus Methanoplasma sp.]